MPCALRHPLHSVQVQGRSVHGTLTLSTTLWPSGVRLLWLWDRGAEKRNRHFVPGAFHSRQVKVLCWDTWPGRNSSLGIRHSPGQVEHMEVWTSWCLLVHIEVLMSWFKPGFAALPTDYWISFMAGPGEKRCREKVTKQPLCRGQKTVPVAFYHSPKLWELWKPNPLQEMKA